MGGSIYLSIYIYIEREIEREITSVRQKQTDRERDGQTDR